MIFSKSFGYALRGVLYVALSADKGPVQLNEIAEALGVPRHFMGKIMKRLAHNSILDSQKGPSGGFEILKISYTWLINKCIHARGG